MNRRRGSRLLLVLLAACGADPAPEPPSLAPLPEVHLDALDASVAGRIRAARARVDEDASGSSYGALGMLYQAAELLEPAVACYRNAIALAPEEARWPYYLAHVHRTAGSTAEALAELERAGARMDAKRDDIQLAALLCWQGDLLLDAGDPDRAGDAFQRALSGPPPHAYAHFGLARAALQRNDDAAALAELRRADALAPNARNVQHLLGTLEQRAGKPEEAARHLALGADLRLPSLGILDPLLRDLEVVGATTVTEMEFGKRMLEAGKFDAAAAAFRRALDLDPDHLEARLSLGSALLRKGDVKGAEREFRTVLDADPEQSEARLQLGGLLARTGRDEDAVAQYRKALERQANRLELRLNLANALARLGRHEEAREQYAEAARMVETNEMAHLGVARMLVLLGRDKEALASLTAARALLPDSAALVHDTARLLVASSDDEVRDGKRGLAMANELMRQRRELQFGETAAMGHAELGEFREATRLQLEVLDAARKLRLTDDLPRIEANLALYRAEKPCRQPWRPEDVVRRPR